VGVKPAALRPVRPRDSRGAVGLAVPLGLGHVEIFSSRALGSVADTAKLRRDLRVELDALWKAINRIASEAGVMPAPWDRKV
jgi:hypothetical protein